MTSEWLIILCIVNKGWRLILGVSGLWRDILFNRYIVILIAFVLVGRDVSLLYVSPWWRRVSLLVGQGEDPSDWFSNNIVKKVYSNPLTKFWSDPWVGLIPLKVRFSWLLSNLRAEIMFYRGGG